MQKFYNFGKKVSFFARLRKILFIFLIFSPCVWLLYKSNYRKSAGEEVLPVATLYNTLDSTVPEAEAPKDKTVILWDELPSVTEIEVLINGKIEKMDIEEYVVLTVLAEMPVSFEDEALKAQSVAARTYAVNAIASKKHTNCDVCADYGHCQSFVSYDTLKQKYSDRADEYYQKIKNIVMSTKGIIATYNGEPINALYHATSAFATNNASDIWGGDAQYLKSVPSPEGLENTFNFKTEYVFTVKDFALKLKPAGVNIDTSKSIASQINNIQYSDSGAVTSLAINGVKISGGKFRSALNLKSQNFELHPEKASVNITVYGYGHGVGMSQNGANLLAKQSYDFYEILKYYYTGINFGFI